MFISLQTIDDLYILFDGLTLNLTVLHVIICQPYLCNNRPPLWLSRSNQLMEFQLIIDQNVPFDCNELRSIIMFLDQVDTFTLIVNQWNSVNQQFTEDHQLQKLIQQFMPQLRHFYCSITTTNDGQ